MDLNFPPYLQIALDLVNKESLRRIISEVPKSSKILLEAGTPLIKKFGISILDKLHSESYKIADLKTLDVGFLEVQIASEAKANAVAVSGLASVETIESSLQEAEKHGIQIILDLMNVKNPKSLLDHLSRTPEIILFHRGIDQEGNLEHPWKLIRLIKKSFVGSLIAVAGGLNIESSEKALRNGADIIVVGRAITSSANIKRTINQFLSLLF